MGEILRYGVLSDTHGSVPPAVFDLFRGVRRIYHCGDAGSQECLMDLEAIAPLRAVYGNMDPWSIAAAWPEKVIEAAEFGTVVLYHGSRFGHSNEAIMQGLYREFAADKPRLILFGHTHAAVSELRHGVLFVNPGSASLPRPGAGPTVAIVGYNAGSGNVDAKIVPLA